jgi:hypothetical protein
MMLSRYTGKILPVLYFHLFILPKYWVLEEELS